MYVLAGSLESDLVEAMQKEPLGHFWFREN